MEIRGKLISFSTYLFKNNLSTEKKCFKKWIKNRLEGRGRKTNKIVCLFESRNFIKKEILVIKKENGSIIRNQQEIISETKKFCENLYIRKDIIETEHIYKNFNIYPT